VVGARNNGRKKDVNSRGDMNVTEEKRREEN
jgi:hypothetical protein